jgi:predicted HD phosphohydrolase
MLAAVLYHEIGHHYQYFTHGVTKKTEQNFADKYKKRMLKKTFFWWRLIMLPFAPLIYLLKRRYTKEER